MNKLYLRNKKATIYLGDSRSMKEVKDNSVDLIITSPPYWNLKNYKEIKQIGLGQTYEEYLAELEKVFQECSRVLRSGRFFALIIGTRVSDGELKHIPADSININKKHNLILKKEIIWTKPKGTQGLWQRGATQFLKTKPYPRNANYNIQHEFILIFQKAGGEIDNKNGSDKLSEEFIKEICWTHWNVKVSNQKNHPAPFPIEIPHKLIRLYSYPGETVLDPFVGSGTTVLAARELDRPSIGYDISEKFCKIAKENIMHLSEKHAASKK